MREQRSAVGKAVVSLDRAQLVGLGFFAVLSGGLMFGLGYASGKTRRGADVAPAAVGLAKVEQNHALHQEMKQDGVDLTFYKALVEKDKERHSKPAPTQAKVAELGPVMQFDKAMEIKAEKAPITAPTPAPAESAIAFAEGDGNGDLAAPKPAHKQAKEPTFASTLSVTQAAPSAAAVVAPKADVHVTDTAANMTIQVSAFKTEGEAQSYTKLLQAKGFKAQVVPGTVAGKGTWYRVRIGHFATAAAAESTKQKLTRENIPAWVVKAE